MVFYSFMHEIIWNLVPLLYTIYIVFILSQVDLHSSKIQLFIQDNHYLIDKAVYTVNFSVNSHVNASTFQPV